MAQYEHLQIYKSTFDLLVYFEKIVRNFSRYNKYTHGSALRNITRDILLLIIRANNSYDKKPVLEEIRIKIEELKQVIHVCKELQVFPNFNSFQTSINQVIEIAKQNEGWLKHSSTRGNRSESQTPS
ncbi:MAG: four helix bundle protein [bacterium]|nr:four helix bundle protein [bacterium]